MRRPLLYSSNAAPESTSQILSGVTPPRAGARLTAAAGAGRGVASAVAGGATSTLRPSG